MTDQEIARQLRTLAKAVDTRADRDNLDDPLHAAFDGMLELADQLDMRRLPVAVYSEAQPPHTAPDAGEFHALGVRQVQCAIHDRLFLILEQAREAKRSPNVAVAENAGAAATAYAVALEIVHEEAVRVLNAVSPSAREERSADRTPTRPDGEHRALVDPPLSPSPAQEQTEPTKAALRKLLLAHGFTETGGGTLTRPEMGNTSGNEMACVEHLLWVACYDTPLGAEIRGLRQSAPPLTDLQGVIADVDARLSDSLTATGRCSVGEADRQLLKRVLAALQGSPDVR